MEFIEFYTVFYSNVSDACAAQLCKVCTAVEGLADVACQRTYICALAAFYAYLALFLFVVIPQQFDVFDSDGLCRNR